MCRSSTQLDLTVMDKLSMFCHVPTTHVFSVFDCPSIYRVPIILEQQKLLPLLQNRLNLRRDAQPTDLFVRWKSLADRCVSFPFRFFLFLFVFFSARSLHSPKPSASRHVRLQDEVVIALVGKYTGLHDSYLSVIKSLEHASIAVGRRLNLKWIDATDLEDSAKSEAPKRYHEAWQSLCSAQGILVPGGFGSRGLEGKMLAATWARTKKVPYLGICLGLQTAVIEFARNVLKLPDAHTTEVREQAENPMVINMPEVSLTQLGGTMRLGTRVTVFKTDKSVTRTTSFSVSLQEPRSLLIVPFRTIGKLYGNVSEINERHRHRYEVNTKYLERLEQNGMRFVGHDKDAERMEILELQDHPYFVAVQFHPEYKTRPLRPAPVFLGLILAASGNLEAYLQDNYKLYA